MFSDIFNFTINQVSFLSNFQTGNIKIYNTKLIKFTDKRGYKKVYIDKN